MLSNDTIAKYKTLLNSIIKTKEALKEGDTNGINKFHNIHKTIAADLKHLNPEPDPNLEKIIRDIIKEIDTTSHIIIKQQNDAVGYLNTEAKKKKIINAYVKE